jgi:hypothetical protein
MIERFDSDSRLGAAGFLVHLPDGRQEGAALPDVFVGCGVGLRADALRGAGGLDRSFFMQAEEYDLAFRLAACGWRVKVFDDLHVNHLKSGDARKSDRTTYYDTRNNLRVAARYLPARHYGVYRKDWLQRYAWLAERDGHVRAFRNGARVGSRWSALERLTHRRRRLASDILEPFFRWGYISGCMAGLAASGVRRVVLADLGKNVFAFWVGARRANLKLLAVGDDRFAAPGRRYRGAPVLPLSEALDLEPDAIVVSNCSAVHGAHTYERLAGVGVATTRGSELRQDGPPVFHWFAPSTGSPSSQAELPPEAKLLRERSLRPPVTVRG